MDSAPQIDPPGSREPSPTLDLIGTVIAGRYRVVKLLGQGGFGTVFLVELVSGLVGSLLALKLISREFSRNERVKARFLNEISITMKLVNKFIVQVRDVGETETGQIYYTMDYCPGETLAAVIAREGTLEPERAIPIALRVLEALRAAHQADVIHRDLTPANVMVIPQGDQETIRVLDFGIATAIGEGNQGRTILGNAPYMAPEQFLNELMGFYTDTWAVGVILYECLTGQRPYKGRTHREVYQDMKSRPLVPPEEIRPELARRPGLSSVIVQALEMSPENRYLTVGGLFDDLKAVLEWKFKPTAPPRRRKRLRLGRKARPAARPAARTAARPPARGGAPRRVRIRRSSSQSPGLAIAVAVAVLGTLLIVALIYSRLGHEEESPAGSNQTPAGTSRP
jgi:serine/threonine protein kinase